MTIKDYKDLKVWQKAKDLAVSCYSVTSAFPSHEQFGITNQIRRSAVSIASNIAEGQQRNTTKDYINFIYIALGSLAELETQLLISAELNYLKKDNEIFASIEEISKMLKGLKNSLYGEKDNISSIKTLTTIS